MRTLLIADTHFNHAKIATYCQRPGDFTKLLVKTWRESVQADDIVIHLGDVFIGPAAGWDEIYPLLPGRKILVRGNHDDQRSVYWWMQHGFQFACDGLQYRNCWLSHKPAPAIPDGCKLNIHGHLHNIWHGFLPDAQMQELTVNMQFEFVVEPWRRLFAVEYTNYCPIEFDEFIAHPDKYLARGKPDPSGHNYVEFMKS